MTSPPTMGKVGIIPLSAPKEDAWLEISITVLNLLDTRLSSPRVGTEFYSSWTPNAYEHLWPAIKEASWVLPSTALGVTVLLPW